jgi:cell division protein FtsB
MAGRVRTPKRERARGSRRRVGARSLIALVLLGFFVVATGVIARRTLGIGQARAIRTLETQRDAMNAARVRLEAEIRDASSRAKLGPIAERRLQMYVPADSQVIILPRERAPRP